MKLKLKPEDLKARQEAEAKANLAATAHDAETAELHATADKMGVTAAWLKEHRAREAKVVSLPKDIAAKAK